MLLSHKDFLTLDTAGCLHFNHSFGKQTRRVVMLLSHMDFLTLDTAVVSAAQIRMIINESKTTYSSFYLFTVMRIVMRRQPLCPE